MAVLDVCMSEEEGNKEVSGRPRSSLLFLVLPRHRLLMLSGNPAQLLVLSLMERGFLYVRVDGESLAPPCAATSPPPRCNLSSSVRCHWKLCGGFTWSSRKLNEIFGTSSNSGGEI